MHIKKLFSLDGRVAVVTGGTERLGYYSAEALSEAGAKVIITSRSRERAEASAEKLAAGTSNSVTGMALDVTDEDSVSNFFCLLGKTHGRVDVLVNNASGRGTTKENGAYAYHYPELQPLEDWDYTIRHNLTSTFLCTKHAVRQMKIGGAGSIINMSSISSLIGRDRSVYADSPDLVPNTADYTAAKAGIIGLTVDFAAQVGLSKIRVNALLPGGFRRDSHPTEFVSRFSSHTMLGRMGEFETDLKGVIVFLASDASLYVTGQMIAVDGGLSNFR